MQMLLNAVVVLFVYLSATYDVHPGTATPVYSICTS